MTQKKQPPLVVIVGLTAVGKTRLALRLAQEFGGAIISAYSPGGIRSFTLALFALQGLPRIIGPNSCICGHFSPLRCFPLIPRDSLVKTSPARPFFLQLSASAIAIFASTSAARELSNVLLEGLGG